MQLVPTRIKQWIGDESPSKRTYDREAVDDVEEAVDPHHHDDPNRASVRERARVRPRTLLVLGLFGLIALGLTARYFGDFFADIATDPRVQQGSLLLLLLFGAYLLGHRRGLSRLQNTTWLVLWVGDDLVRYPGEITTVRDNGEQIPIFTPYAGWSSIRSSPRSLTHEELGSELTSVRGRHIDPEAPAQIGLSQVPTARVDTDDGTVVGALSSGIEPHPYGEHSALYAKRPDMANKDQMRELKELLDYYAEQRVPALKAEIDMLDDHVELLKERAGLSHEQQIEQLLDLANVFQAAHPDGRLAESDEDETDVAEAGAFPEEARRRLMQNGGGES